MRALSGRACGDLSNPGAFAIANPVEPHAPHGALNVIFNEHRSVAGLAPTFLLMSLRNFRAK
jgi:hypothetical protein